MKLSCRGMRFLPRQPGRTLRPTYNGWKLGDTTDEPAPWRAVWLRSVMPGMVCWGVRRGTASLLGAATHPLGAMPGGRVPPMPRGTRWVSFLGLGCGVVGIVLRCLAQPRLKRGLLTMATLRLWSGLVSSGRRYQLQRRGPSLSATTSALTSTSSAPCPALRGNRLPGTGALPLPAMQSSPVRGLCGERMRAVRAAWLEPLA